MHGGVGLAADGERWMRGAPGPRPAIAMLALTYALGITLGWKQPHPWVWPWLLVSCLALLGCLLAGRMRPRVAQLLMFASAVGLGAAWVTIRYDWVRADDLAGRLGDAPVLVRVRGIALEEPVLRDQSNGSMDRFDYRPPVTCFPMSVNGLVGEAGRLTRASGEVLVRVEGSVAPFRPGDTIIALGFLEPIGPPHNPGEFDYQRFARSLGQAGILMVKSRALMEVEPADRSLTRSIWLRWRDRLQHRATGWLLSDLPGTERGDRDALLAALLLGQRGRELDGLGRAFTEVGLAHVLAISGLHLGILIGFVLMLVRAGGTHRRWHGWLVVAAVLMYLTIVQVRLPVLRAAVMIVVVAIGVICGRRWRVSSLVALSGIGLLTWRPDQLFGAGFQLSFGVVLGLIHLAPAVRRRWFGPPDLAAASTAQMIGEWLKSALAAAVTAWLIATPIVAHHFGFVSPFGAPLSVLVLPVVAVLLVVGFAKMLLAVVLPSAALLVGTVLTVWADVLISIVGAADAAPLSVIYVTQPRVVITLAALGWVCLWGVHPAHWRRRRRLLWMAGLAILVSAAWPMMPWRGRPDFRIDMLSVGEGACFIIRSGGATVMYDAGSASNPNIGHDSIVPAARKLGVRKIDALAISHGNLDHYSAVLEVVDGFNVDRVLVTPQFTLEAESDPAGSVAFLMDELINRRIRVEMVAAGEARKIGKSNWTWLHPPSDTRLKRVNDESTVLRIEMAGRVILLTGDIQNEAIGMLLAGDVDLHADILELPHHGSYKPVSVEFVSRVGPEMVMQSCGRRRWLTDRWQQHLVGVDRLMTARDGACWVEIDEAGVMNVGRYLVEDHP